MTEEAIQPTPAPDAPSGETPPASEPRSPGFTDWARGLFKSSPPAAEPAPDAPLEPSEAEPSEPAAPPAPFKTYTSREEHDRAIQAEVDRREAARQKREAEQAEQQRQARIRELSANVARMKASGDTYSDEYTEQAGELADLVAGVHREQETVQSQRELMSSAYGQSVNYYDRATLQGLTATLSEDEAADVLKALGDLSAQQQEHFAKGDGSLADGVAIRTQGLETVAKRLIDIGGRRAMHTLRADPEFRKELMAELMTEEPTHTVGAPSARGSVYRTLEALTAAHAHGEIDNDAFLRQRRAFA